MPVPSVFIQCWHVTKVRTSPGCVGDAEDGIVSLACQYLYDHIGSGATNATHDLKCDLHLLLSDAAPVSTYRQGPRPTRTRADSCTPRCRMHGAELTSFMRVQAASAVSGFGVSINSGPRVVGWVGIGIAGAS